MKIGAVRTAGASTLSLGVASTGAAAAEGATLPLELLGEVQKFADDKTFVALLGLTRR